MKVIIFSCDKYSWLMPTFLHFYRKNWPDNPYETVVVTETIKTEGVNTFCAGKIPWSDGAIKYLESINEEKFFMLFDDYIIEKKVNTDKVKEAENLCSGVIGCVRLNPYDGHERFLIDARVKGFKEYPLDKPYSVSLESAIWQKEFFLEILQKGENVWQVEVEGSKRVSKSNKKVVWSDSPIILHCRPGGYMKKGKVVKSVKQWVKDNW